MSCVHCHADAKFRERYGARLFCGAPCRRKFYLIRCSANTESLFHGQYIDLNVELENIKRRARKHKVELLVPIILELKDKHPHGPLSAALLLFDKIGWRVMSDERTTPNERIFIVDSMVNLLPFPRRIETTDEMHAHLEVMREFINAEREQKGEPLLPEKKQEGWGRDKFWYDAREWVLIWNQEHAYLVDSEKDQGVELVYGFFFPTYDIYMSTGKDMHPLKNAKEVLERWE